MTLRTAIDRYIDWQRTMGAVYCSQAFELRRFCRSVGDSATCDAVSDDHARAFIDGGHCGARSRRPRYYLLAGFYRFALSRGLVTRSPLPPTAPQPTPPTAAHVYTRAELSRLLDATEASQARARQLAPHTLRALLVLLYGTGLRRGEALRLTLADVNLTDRLLIVRESKFNKTRLVPLGPQLARAMEHYAVRKKLDGASQSGDTPFFANRDGTPLAPTTVSGAFRRLRRTAGVAGAAGERQPNLHGLRHNSEFRIIPSCAQVATQ